MSSLSGRSALVTGGARGIGLEVCRQLAGLGARVWLTARDLDRAEQAAAELRVDGDVVAAQLDIKDEESVRRLAGRVNRLDILVNNAAIDYDADQQAFEVGLDRVHAALETNLFGAWRTAQAFTGQLRSSSHGRLVNVSSEGGSITQMGGGLPCYRVSKLALNGLTRMLAAELASDGVLVNSVCPGWMDTDMGGGG
jgi:NAD(P)-dependent dehydrogenase (short-subunit alcohol dehydrogenase family)